MLIPMFSASNRGNQNLLVSLPNQISAVGYKQLWKKYNRNWNVDLKETSYGRQLYWCVVFNDVINIQRGLKIGFVFHFLTGFFKFLEEKRWISELSNVGGVLNFFSYSRQAFVRAQNSIIEYTIAYV